MRTSTVSEGFAGGAGSDKFSFRRRQDGGYTLSLGNYVDHYLGADSFRYFADVLPALKMTGSAIRLRYDDGLLKRLFPTRRWEGDEISKQKMADYIPLKRLGTPNDMSDGEYL